MTAIIGTYDYTYGSGSQTNRQIQFSRTGAGPGTIQANVFVLNGNVVGTPISTITGNQISVEMQSTSQKANAMNLARQNNTNYVPVPNQNLSSLGVNLQNTVIGSLGTRHIDVTNNVGAPGGYELPSSLTIFDPT